MGWMSRVNAILLVCSNLFVTFREVPLPYSNVMLRTYLTCVHQVTVLRSGRVECARQSCESRPKSVFTLKRVCAHNPKTYTYAVLVVVTPFNLFPNVFSISAHNSSRLCWEQSRHCTPWLPRGYRFPRLRNARITLPARPMAVSTMSLEALGSPPLWADRRRLTPSLVRERAFHCHLRRSTPTICPASPIEMFGRPGSTHRLSWA